MLELKRGKNCNIPCTIRFPESLYEKLKDIAKSNEISFNSLIIQLCEYAINDLKDTTK